MASGARDGGPRRSQPEEAAQATTANPIHKEVTARPRSTSTVRPSETLHPGLGGHGTCPPTPTIGSLTFHPRALVNRNALQPFTERVVVRGAQPGVRVAEFPQSEID